MNPLGSVQILVVDDNRAMRLLVKSMLRAVGVGSILDAQDPADALSILRVSPVDLVITDFSMRPIDGVEFATMVRKSPDSPNPYVSIILMTGHSERHRVQAARDAGVNSFLAKPVSARSLLQRLTAVVNDSRPFVRSPTYFGPDRRGAGDPRYAGPRRRRSDAAGERFDLDAP